jgi:RNA polymerase sigma-70 factor (ECF subfamily)
MVQDPSEDSRRDTPGKEEQLTALFDSCYPRIARYAFARIGNQTDAEDIAAEVFVRAFESLDSFRERGLPMEAWLFRIAHNLVVDRFRHNSRFQRSAEEDVDIQDDADPAGLAEQRVLIRDVRKAMECLTPDQREVVRLRFFAGLSSKETAAVMRKKDGAVREMQRAALEKLRGLLG